MANNSFITHIHPHSSQFASSQIQITSQIHKNDVWHDGIHEWTHTTHKWHREFMSELSQFKTVKDSVKNTQIDGCFNISMISTNIQTKINLKSSLTN